MNQRPLRTLFLFASAGFLVISISEYMRVGFAESYWLMLLAVACLLLFQYFRLNDKARRRKPDHPAVRKETAVRPKPKKR